MLKFYIANLTKNVFILVIEDKALKLSFNKQYYIELERSLA